MYYTILYNIYTGTILYDIISVHVLYYTIYLLRPRVRLTVLDLNHTHSITISISHDSLAL